MCKRNQLLVLPLLVVFLLSSCAIGRLVKHTDELIVTTTGTVKDVKQQGDNWNKELWAFWYEIKGPLTTAVIGFFVWKGAKWHTQSNNRKGRKE